MCQSCIRMMWYWSFWCISWTNVDLTQWEMNLGIKAKPVTPVHVLENRNASRLRFVVHCESKSSFLPSKTLQYYHLLSIFSWKFFSFLLIHAHIITNFRWFLLIFIKIALILLRIPIVFTVSIFEFHEVKLPRLYRQGWVAPSLPDINPLDYQFWWQCWSLITGSNRSHKQLPSLKTHFNRLLLQACRSANGGYYEHIM